MNRRDFLRRMATATAGVAALEIDPERLLWVPGAKTFFLPAPQIVRPEETAEVRDLIDQATHRIVSPYRYRLTLGGGFDQETYVFDDEWKLLRKNAQDLTPEESARINAVLFTRTMTRQEWRARQEKW